VTTVTDFSCKTSVTGKERGSGQVKEIIGKGQSF